MAAWAWRSSLRPWRTPTRCWSARANLRPSPRPRASRPGRGAEGPRTPHVVIDAQHTAYGRLPEGARIPPLWLQPLVYLVVVALVMAGMLVKSLAAGALFTFTGNEPPPYLTESRIAGLLSATVVQVLAVAIVMIWIRKVEL